MYILISFTVLMLCVDCFYIQTLYSTTETNVAEEVQNAVCKITTKELEASANATITKQLKGVCTTSYVDSKLDQLQAKILQEFDNIRYILKENGFKVPTTNMEDDYDAINKNDGDSYEKIKVKTYVARTDEVFMYNDSIRESHDGKVYFYYWKIHKIYELLSKSHIYISSPVFSVLGHNLRLQLYPNYVEKKYFAIQLRPASNGFLKKHRITIINQKNAELDIDSGKLYGLRGENFFVVDESNLTEGSIQHNSMTVKLEIYLNS